MTNIYVSVHELKARMSEYIGRSIPGKERIIIKRHNKPVAMIVPLLNEEKKGSGGLAEVDWTQFDGFASNLDEVYSKRQEEGFREIPL